MKTDYRTKEDIIKARKHRDRCTIRLTILAIMLIVGYAAIESAYAHRTRYSAPVEGGTIENISITNITNVSEITVEDGGTVKLSGNGGKIAFADLATDVISIENSLLQLQQQVDDFAIVNTTIIGTLEIFGDDDTAGADEIAFQLVTTATSTWTDGDEDSRAEMGVVNNGTINDDQLVLNTDGTVDVGTAQVGGLEQTYRFNMADPATLQGNDSQWSIDPRTTAAMTITRIDITMDADPTTEMDWDLKFADAFIGLASATLIVAMDTTAGAAAITSFTDATVPANKCIYVEFGAAPDVAALQVNVTIFWDYD